MSRSPSAVMPGTRQTGTAATWAQDPAAASTAALPRISPELVDVLTEIITRIRGQDGTVPLVTAYDAGTVENCRSAVRRRPGASSYPRMYHDGATTGLVLRVALWLPV